MAIPAVNVSYSGNGPTASGQILADCGLAGNFSRTLIGTATFVLDGSLTAGTLNYIDGSATLGYAPGAIFATRIGGTAAQTVTVTSVVDGANAGLSATVNFGAAGTNTNTVIIAFMICK